MIKCIDCVFYRQREGEASLGTCKYPLPAYLITSVSGGNFIACDGCEHDCATFKAFAEVVSND